MWLITIVQATHATQLLVPKLIPTMGDFIDIVYKEYTYPHHHLQKRRSMMPSAVNDSITNQWKCCLLNKGWNSGFNKHINKHNQTKSTLYSTQRSSGTFRSTFPKTGSTSEQTMSLWTRKWATDNRHISHTVNFFKYSLHCWRLFRTS